LPYQVKPDGSIVADTLDEAIALSRRLRGLPARRSRQTKAEKPEKQDSERGLALLHAAVEAGDSGLEAKELANKLGIQNARGLSASIQAARRLIASRATNGRPEEDFFERRRSREGTFWVAHVEALKEIGLI
jgi:hypothetical protein